MIIQIGTEADESRILWKHYDHEEWQRADIDDIRQDLEQKCYFCNDNHDHFKELSNLIMDIKPAEIVEHIKEDRLKKWCLELQVAMMMELIQLETKK